MSGINQACLVPDTFTEYFSCCLYPTECESFYYINWTLLIAMVLSFTAGLIWVKWVRFQVLLWVAVFFQCIVLIWRILYSGIGGYVTASWFEYITYRTSDPGDVPSFCIPIALILFDLKNKVAAKEGFTRVCNGRNCKLFFTDLGLFTLYSIIWGVLYMRSKDVNFSLELVQYGTGAMIALFAIPFTLLGLSLHKQQQASVINGGSFPGKK
jgi:hypothetical protein